VSILIPSEDSNEGVETVAGNWDAQDTIDGMTWRRLTARRIVAMRVLCSMGELFSLADLYENAINIRGHRLIRTAFKVREPQGKTAIYYCWCGQIAIERGDKIVGVAADASEGELTPCAYLWRRSSQT
jgi:hypothetical protein